MTTHATQLAVFSLWTGFLVDDDDLNEDRYYELIRLFRGAAMDRDHANPGYSACRNFPDVDCLAESTRIRQLFPSCPECAAICEIALVAHDAHAQMQEEQL